MKVVSVEGISKKYRLGSIGTGSLKEDIWGFFKKSTENSLFTYNSSEANKEYWALRDVSFDVKQGEVLGIIGKNGAGKSTLLKILSRITKPTTGEVNIKGRLSSLLEVGTGFHPDLTGRENIFLNGAILGMTKPEIKNKLDEIIDFSGVEKFIDTPVKRYSSGMYVRLAFSVAAHLEPEILIIDEVLAVGDAEFQKKCLGKMKDVNDKQGRTILFVSHQMGAISDLCKNAIYLKEGGLIKSGPVEEVIKYYFEQNSIQSAKSISERIDRPGNGHTRIVDIKLIDEKSGKSLEHILSGDDVVIEIRYESSDKNPIKDLQLGMPVFTQNEQFITPLNNKMSNFYFNNVPSKGTICCRISRLPFMSGEYHISPSLFINSELSDKIEKGFFFSVEQNDYYKSGTPSSFNRQGVYVNQQWFVKE